MIKLCSQLGILRRIKSESVHVGPPEGQHGEPLWGLHTEISSWLCAESELTLYRKYLYKEIIHQSALFVLMFSNYGHYQSLLMDVCCSSTETSRKDQK